MLCTVQCRPASACARKSPPGGCTLKKQDKTRQDNMVTALNGALKAWGLTLCPKKSRCMVFGKDDDTPHLTIRVEGEKMDQVDKFCYLGTIISTDGTCSAAIDDRTRKAWVRLHQSHFIWRLRGLSRKARATSFRCIVLTTLLHRCERWTLSAADMTKLRKNHHNLLAKALNGALKTRTDAKAEVVALTLQAKEIAQERKKNKIPGKRKRRR